MFLWRLIQSQVRNYKRDVVCCLVLVEERIFMLHDANIYLVIKKPMALTTVYLLDYHAISLVSFAAVVWSCHAARSLSQEYW